MRLLIALITILSLNIAYSKESNEMVQLKKDYSFLQKKEKLRITEKNRRTQLAAWYKKNKPSEREYCTQVYKTTLEGCLNDADRYFDDIITCNSEIKKLNIKLEDPELDQLNEEKYQESIERYNQLGKLLKEIQAVNNIIIKYLKINKIRHAKKYFKKISPIEDKIYNLMKSRKLIDRSWLTPEELDGKEIAKQKQDIIKRYKTLKNNLNR